MEKIVIYTTMDEDHYKLGSPAAHTLYEPAISRTWITRAEYILPDGYSVKMSNGDRLEIYDADGRHCPLADSQVYGNGGGEPLLVDIHSDEQLTRLEKVRDLPWEA